ncbi:MAG: HD domain-containing protein, partial [Bdellovibrionota bacterium]
RLDAFLQKGISHFHMRKSIQEDYLAYCDRFAASLVGAKGERASKIPLKLKIAQTANHGDQVIKFIKSNGVTDSSIEYAKGFLDNTRMLISALPIENSETFRGFVLDILNYEHAVVATMLVALLAKTLKIDADRNTKALGLAAFLHDIGLYSSGLYASSSALQMEDLLLMNEEEKHVFRSHPLTSAELLRNAGFADPLVLQMIEQHHERIDRSGFPKEIGLGQITEMTETVALCDEFSSFLRSNPELVSKGTASALLVDKLEGRYTKKLIEAFMTTFIGKT